MVLRGYARKYVRICLRALVYLRAHACVNVCVRLHARTLSSARVYKFVHVARLRVH